MSGKVIIVGGCAGAKVAYDIFKLQDYSVWFADNYTKEWDGIQPSILNESETLYFLSWPEVSWFVATGDNIERDVVARQYEAISEGPWVNAIHPDARRSPFSHLGRGNLLCAMSYVGVGARLFDGCIVNTAATIDHDCTVGNLAQIGPGAHICGYVTIGERAFVGAGATILPHVRVGDDAVVGAGAVVTKDVAARTKVVGVPAEVLAC